MKKFEQLPTSDINALESVDFVGFVGIFPFLFNGEHLIYTCHWKWMGLSLGTSIHYLTRILYCKICVFIWGVFPCRWDFLLGSSASSLQSGRRPLSLLAPRASSQPAAPQVCQPRWSQVTQCQNQAGEAAFRHFVCTVGLWACRWFVVLFVLLSELLIT